MRFRDSDRRVPQFYQIYQEMEDRVEAQRIAERKARDVHERAGKLPSDFHLQPVPPSADEIASCVKRIAEQSDLLIRQMLWLNYLDLTVTNRSSDPAMVSKALETLTPLSMVWALRPQLADLAVNASSSPKKFRDYVTAMVLNLPTPDIQAKVLWRLAMAADEAKQTNKRDRYTELLQERFPDHPSTKVVASFFGKDRKVMAGKTVPPFSAPSFDDPKVIYTNKNLNAKVYMIDFWATWCGPCIGEMPYLHRAYERYKGKGFQILSYSLDSVRELVVKFHAEKWKMPWLNAIDLELRAFDSDIAKAFDLYGIPAAILVDPGTNKIIAVNEEIRGEKLEKVLAEVFKELAP